MVTILEEARVPFLREPFDDDIDEIGLLIARGQVALQRATAAEGFAAAGDDVVETGTRRRLHDRLRGAVGEQPPDSKPAVIAETQLATVHIKEQRLQRLTPAQQEYLQRWHAMSSPRARHLAGRRHSPRGPRHVRRAGAAARRRRGHPAAGTRGRSGRRLGGNRFRCAGQSGGGGPGATGRPVRRRRRAGARPERDGPQRARRPRFPMDSAWRGALPPDTGFAHIDDVPARVVLDLAQRGVALAKEHGSSHGPPVSLLDQEVLAVSSERRRRRDPDALRIRLDRNGFPAAVVRRPRRGHGQLAIPRRWPPTRSCGCVRCPHGCGSTPDSARCTAAAATRSCCCACVLRHFVGTSRTPRCASSSVRGPAVAGGVSCADTHARQRN